MQIRAAVVREKSGPFQIESVSIEDPRDDEILVAIAGVGVCHTDLVCRDQYFPVPLPLIAWLLDLRFLIDDLDTFMATDAAAVPDRLAVVHPGLA